MTDKKTKTKEPSLVVTQESLTAELAAIAKDVATPRKNKGGRPTIYSQELVDELCIRLGMGRSLRSICQDDDMPAQSQVYVWLNRYPEFREHYARAREEQAETHADEIVDIADETPELKEIRDKDGKVIDITLDSAFIAWQKQRIDARKWNAAKQRPKKYGDRVTHAGDDENPMVLEASHNVFGELLKAIKMERQEKAYGDK